jgi:hypothetical protein
MKKAKLMLTAITIFAVVGGALAFNAKSSDKMYCGNSTNGICDEEITHIKPGGNVNKRDCSLTKLTTTCAEVFTTAGL